MKMQKVVGTNLWYCLHQDWIRFLISLINENKIWFLGSSVLILLLTGVTLVQTWVIQNLVDKTTEFDYEGIIQMLFVLFIIVVLILYLII